MFGFKRRKFYLYLVELCTPARWKIPANVYKR